MEPKKQLDKVNRLITNAILFFLDAAENTVVEGSLLSDLKENGTDSILNILKQENLLTPRLLALIDVYNESVRMTCTCNESDLEIDCPAIVCKSCKNIFYVKTDNTIKYCKSCVGFDKCIAKKYCQEHNK